MTRLIPVILKRHHPCVVQAMVLAAYAPMLELVDNLVLETKARKGVGVRLSLGARDRPYRWRWETYQELDRAKTL